MTKRILTNYHEDPDVLDYMNKNLPRQGKAKWIRNLTRKKMEADKKK